MTASYELALMDAVEWLRTLADESVALGVTDYAYESLEKHRAKGTTTRLKQSDGSSNEWFDIFRNGRVPELMAELHRVLAPNAHLYMLADEETTIDVVRPMGRDAGFTWWKSIVWVKTKGANTGELVELERDLAADEVKIGMGYHWRASNERISFLEKGKRRLNHLGWPDVLPAPRVSGYPTEKPVSLLRTLIENSSSPGELVIDPFHGSGSCGEAALRCGRLFAGSDVSAKAHALASARLAAFGQPGRVTTPRRAPAQGSLFGGLG